MPFVSDSFTAPSGTLLTAHTAQTTWAQATGSGTNAPVISDANRLRGSNSAQSAMMYASGIPASAEYDVEALVRRVTNAGSIGPAGRIDTAADTGYFVHLSATTITLRRRVAGTSTDIGSYTDAGFIDGVERTIKLELRDATKKVYVDGVERISSTDNAITATGRAGVRLLGSHTDTTGFHLDNFSASDTTTVLSLGGAAVPTRVGAPTLTTGPVAPVTLSLGGASTATRVGSPRLTSEPGPSVIRITRPPIGLAIEMRTPEGAGTTWDSHGDAEHIPKGISFSTRRGEGFAEASCVLSRRVDREYPDLGLLDEAIIHGEDGSTAFEGRLAAVPRSYSEAHELTPQFVGWMAHAKDRSITQIYVDRDPANWVAGSVERRQKWLDQGRALNEPTLVMDSRGMAAVETGFDRDGGVYSDLNTVSEAWYDAGAGNLLGGLYADPRVQHFGPSSYFDWRSRFAADDSASPAIEASPNRPNAPFRFTPVGSYRYAYLDLFNSTSSGASQNRDMVRWRRLAVYGDHGLPLLGEEPSGVAASDVIRHLVTTYCPMLRPAGILPTTFPIAHLAFRDRITPHDAMLEVNKHHLWDLAVWDDRTLHYRPHDLLDHDWEVRLSDRNATLELQGDSIEHLVNGIAVSFDNVSTLSRENRVRDVVSPDKYPELADRSPDNPANRHGYEKWLELELSTPTTLAGALAIGQSWLAEHNAPRAPGTINVKGYIRDRSGYLQPVWKVRAGDTVAVTDHPNDRSRLIAETRYEHDTYTLSIGVDGELRRMEAVLDRLANAQVSAGSSR